jgi:hypothetical protein
VFFIVVMVHASFDFVAFFLLLLGKLLVEPLLLSLLLELSGEARQENSIGTVLLLTISKYWWENSVIEVGSVWMWLLDK